MAPDLKDPSDDYAGGLVRGLVTIGFVLVVLWVVGLVVFKVAGFLIHLLLLIGALMLIMGLVQRVRGGTTNPGPKM